MEGLMKVFVLTSFANEDQFAPTVFKSKEDAQAEMDRQYLKSVDGYRGTPARTESSEDTCILEFDDEEYRCWHIFETELK